jgi:phage-related protein
MGKVASVAQQALGVFTGQMMTRAVDALANLGKSALDSVGQLEQNVGGVETLFGDAADAVIASADRAYQTAGMSANDYMSTVTSFSASLLQSLGGNTEEAAKVADMAIIDMADNANKMGTSMDMIQNAYQGFAKQNYTMLDNLKLGYGGTKTEMERLLADAEKLTGVKYDINNLNDVYQAIHAVQEEMRITGTTAKEAASTLEGSMASAKAAWDNFMNGSGDADQLADAFATAADNIVKNLAEIIPRFAETLPALGGAIIAQIPGLVAAIVPAVLSAGQSVLKQLQDAVLDFDFAGTADKVVQMITGFIEGDGLGSLLDTLVTIFTGIVNGISSMLPSLLPALIELISYVVTSLLDQLPAILDCALELILGLAQGILAALPVLIEALPEVISSIVEFLISAVPQIIDVLAELPGLIGEVFAEIVTDLVEWGQQMLSNASMAMSNMLSKVSGIIQELPGKIWTHLVNAVNKVIAWGQQMVSNASTAASNMLSKVSGIIQELPGKIWTHLVNTVNKVVAWGQQMVSNASTAASSMLSKVSSTLQQLPGKVWDYLSQAAQKVVTWGTQLAQKGTAAATQLFNSIVNGLSSLPSKMAEIGGNIVSGIWNGISSGWNWLTNKVSNLANSLLDAAKDALGINSPSKEFADKVGRWIMPGVGKGLDKSMPATLKDMKAKAGELVSAMRAEMSASVGQLSVGASHAAGLRMAGAGTTVYNDNRMEQSNTYNVPVATPSEVAKKQREALRNMVGGVK